MDKKILYVDDQRRFREEVSKALKELPIKLIFAEDGLEGLVKFRKEKPDLVILDAMLPKLHGFQLCKVIKSSLPAEKLIPVFILTGVFRDNNSREDALSKFGADVYMTKPFSPAELLEQVKTYLP